MSKRITTIRSLVAVLACPICVASVCGQDTDGLQSILIPSESTNVAPANFQEPIETPPPVPVPLAEAESDASTQFEELPSAQPLPQPPVPGENVSDAPQPPRAERNGPIDRSEARSNAMGLSGAGVEGGVKIVGLIVNGPASQSGLKLGDIIQSINGTELYSAAELVRVVAAAPAGKPMEVNIIRDGKLMAASVTAVNATTSSRGPAVRSSAPPTRTYRRNIVIRTPGFQMETTASIPSGSATTRLRVAPAPRIPVPAIRPPVGIRPPIAIRPPVAVVRPAIPRPPTGPPRFIRPGRRFGR